MRRIFLNLSSKRYIEEVSIMRKNSILYLLIAFCLAVSIPALAQQHSSKLLALIGQKCTAMLTNGDLVSGTLWDYGDDYVSLKVKKGLLYSKTEKYGISEIEYIDDALGNRLYFGDDSERGDGDPTAVYFSLDDPEVEEPAAEEDAQTLKSGAERVEKTTPTASDSRAASSNPDGSLSSTVAGKPVVKQKTKSSTSSNESTAEFIQEIVSNTESNKETVVEESAKISENTQTPSVARKRSIPKVATTDVSGLQEPSRKIRVLRYQTAILFGVVALIAAVMVISRVAGMRGSAYGKHSLFPSKLVKMNGRYGVIDQGYEDGVKVDDIIRLYRKTGQDVVFRGKVQVKKVAENYSAVEVLKKMPGSRLEVGDVGFRDRNFIFTFIKRSRILASAGLSSLGKGLLYTARNIEIRESDPKIDLAGDQDVETTKVQKRVARKIASKPKKPAATKHKVVANKSGDSEKPAGFGVS